MHVATSPLRAAKESSLSLAIEAWPALTLEHGLGTNYATPFALARSAIFSTQRFRSHVERPTFSAKTKLAALGNLSIYQLYGQQLDQGDADVLYELLRRVFEKGQGGQREARVQFNRIELIRSLGRSKGGKTVQLLTESLNRLTEATFFIQIPGVFSGRSRLILKALSREDVVGQAFDFDVLLDMELAQLFNNDQWALLRKSERLALNDDPLAKGLHAYFATHAQPFPVLPSTLQALMGRGSMQHSKWMLALTDSLASVKKATGWIQCEVARKGPHTGKVVVVRDAPKRVTYVPDSDEDI